MAILILCILANVMIAIIFKLFPKYGIDNFQAIIFNYFTCLIVGTLQLGEFPVPANFMDQDWMPFVAILGFLFVIGFNLNAAATQKIGISYTALIQKLSLIVPSTIAIIFFNESTTLLKILGIIGAIVAIILIQIPSKKKGVESKELQLKDFALLASGVYLIAAAIEVLLYYMSIKGISTGADITVVSSVFGLAGVLGLIALVVQLARGKTKFSSKNIVAGILLGIPNFYSIYLLVYLLGKDWEASVLFPTNNVGIIALSALIAVVFFAEKLNIYKWIGLVVAVASIILISM